MMKTSMKNILMLSGVFLLLGGTTTSVSAHYKADKNVHVSKIKHLKKHHKTKKRKKNKKYKAHKIHKAHKKRIVDNRSNQSNKQNGTPEYSGQWNQGVPSVMQGTWYHNDANNLLKAYISYSNNQSGGNFFNESANGQGFKEQNPSGLKDISSRYLGNSTFEIKGYRYDSQINNGQMNQENPYAYKVIVDNDNDTLHFTLGHGVKDYSRTPNFKIDTGNDVSSESDGMVY